MVSTTHGYGELIAHFSCKGAALYKSKVVGIGWPSPANNTGLLGDEFDVLSIADPARLRQGERTFVDCRFGAPPRFFDFFAS